MADDEQSAEQGTAEPAGERPLGATAVESVSGRLGVGGMHPRCDTPREASVARSAGVGREARVLRGGDGAAPPASMNGA